jgi:hypothetical protein
MNIPSLGFVFFALFCVSVVSAQPIQFAMMMTGNCDVESANCTVKGNSQVITTLISAQNDAISFDVKSTIGAYATLTFTVSSPTEPGGGVMSFGTHLARNHTLGFSLFSAEGVIPGGGPDQYIITGSYNVVAGSGAFEGAFGAIAFTTDYDSVSGDATTFVHGVVYVKQAKA